MAWSTLPCSCKVLIQVLKMAPLTLGGPRITPLHRVKVMSSSSSKPQLTVPSPTPFWPSSSSSRSRKLRGTLTPVCGQTHSHSVMQTSRATGRFTKLNKTASSVPDKMTCSYEVMTQWDRKNKGRLSCAAYVSLLIRAGVIFTSCETWASGSGGAASLGLRSEIRRGCTLNRAIQTNPVTLPAAAAIQLSSPASPEKLSAGHVSLMSSRKTYSHCLRLTAGQEDRLTAGFTRISWWHLSNATHPVCNTSRL